MSETTPPEDWVQRRVDATRRSLSAPPAPSPAAPPACTLTPPRSPRALAPFVDHTVLKAQTTVDDALQAAGEAKASGFAAVCVNPWLLARVAKALRDSPVRPVTVIGFPLGASFSEMKAAEAAWSVQSGARELDVVLNIGALKAGLLREALDDLKGMVEASAGYPVKVILETHLLTGEEKVDACVLAELAEASFVKTSTGFGGGGATVDDVQLLRRATGDRLGVKASGGIRDAAAALALVAAGAQRLGTSASMSLIRGGTAEGGY